MDINRIVLGILIVSAVFSGLIILNDFRYYVKMGYMSRSGPFFTRDFVFLFLFYFVVLNVILTLFMTAVLLASSFVNFLKE